MKIWWQSLQERERQMLAAAALILIAALLFVSLIEPLAQKRQQLTQTLSAEKSMLGRLQESAFQAETIKQRLARAPIEIGGQDQSLLSLIDGTAERHQLKKHIKRVVPSGANQASLAFDSVPFDNLIAYLVQLQLEFGVVVTRINTDKLAEPGLVRVNLTLKR